MDHEAQYIIDRLKERRVVVIGDAVADQFLEGNISRISREAPVFILRHERTLTLPGAAANAAANIAGLGASAILLSVIGADESGELLIDALEDAGVATDGIIRSPGIPTPTKTRVMAARDYSPLQQVIRIDREPPEGALEAVSSELVEQLQSVAADADAIIVSDYGYGVVTPELFNNALRAASEREIPLVVDSRYRLADLNGATSATPNREEVRNILGTNCDDASCEDLRRRLGLKALLMTNGNQGMSLFEENKASFKIPAVGSIEPVDVTGAGDTVIAAYSLALAAGMSFRDAATIANHAGGLVVMKRGTATVSPEELRESLTEHDISAFAKP